MPGDRGERALVSRAHPEVRADGLVEHDHRRAAVVKNPTVIALTFVWWVGLVRQAVRYDPADDLAATPGPSGG